MFVCLVKHCTLVKHSALDSSKVYPLDNGKTWYIVH